MKRPLYGFDLKTGGNHRNGYYTGLQLSGKLDRHLEEINRQAKEIIDHIVFQMVKVLGVTEQLKASDQPKRNDEQYPSNGGRNRFEGIDLKLMKITIRTRTRVIEASIFVVFWESFRPR